MSSGSDENSFHLEWLLRGTVRCGCECSVALAPFLSAWPRMEPKKWYMKESRERLQAWHCLWGYHATSVP